MKDLRQLNIELYDYLRENHVGAKKAVPSFKLEAAFDLNGTQIRKAVNTLRVCGYPICSDFNGYYFAKNKNEVLKTIAQLSSRTKKINDAKKGLSKSVAFINPLA